MSERLDVMSLTQIVDGPPTKDFVDGSGKMVKEPGVLLGYVATARERRQHLEDLGVDMRWAEYNCDADVGSGVSCPRASPTLSRISTRMGTSRVDLRPVHPRARSPGYRHRLEVRRTGRSFPSIFICERHRPKTSMRWPPRAVGSEQDGDGRFVWSYTTGGSCTTNYIAYACLKNASGDQITGDVTSCSTGGEYISNLKIKGNKATWLVSNGYTSARYSANPGTRPAP